MAAAAQALRVRARAGVLDRPAWWLVPIVGMAGLLVLAIASAVVMSLHPHREGIIIYDEWTLANYARFLFDPYYLGVLGTTTVVGVIVVLLTLVLGYAPAYL
ncbi:MAG: hypothetical protein ACREGL_09825, partial [Alphaproteobacteria bacterium]